MSKVATIREEIRHAINSGEFPPGHKLALQEEIADEYCTGVSTVHAALKPLKASGLIYTSHNGTFVGPRPFKGDFPVRDAPKEVECGGKKCNNLFEVRKWRGMEEFIHLMYKAGWTCRGSNMMVLCHQCSNERNSK